MVVIERQSHPVSLKGNHEKGCIDSTNPGVTVLLFCCLVFGVWYKFIEQTSNARVAPSFIPIEYGCIRVILFNFYHNVAKMMFQGKRELKNEELRIMTKNEE